MTDQELWSAAAASVSSCYAALPPVLKRDVAGLLTEIGGLKERSAALAVAEELCTACRGICCRFGKHHVSVVDLLGYLVRGRELFTPHFEDPVCPYHTGSGCVMEPALRPLNCVIFICELIEDCLDEPAKAALASTEQQLRRLYGRLELLLGNRFENGLLITYERCMVSGEPLFRY